MNNARDTRYQIEFFKYIKYILHFKTATELSLIILSSRNKFCKIWGVKAKTFKPIIKSGL